MKHYNDQIKLLVDAEEKITVCKLKGFAYCNDDSEKPYPRQVSEWSDDGVHPYGQHRHTYIKQLERAIKSNVQYARL